MTTGKNGFFPATGPPANRLFGCEMSRSRVFFLASVISISMWATLALCSDGSHHGLLQQEERGLLNPYPNKPRLVFRPDGSFKLSVFSDLHFGENPWDDWGPEQDRKSLVVMNNMLALEEPDFVAVNGDLITGDNTFQENSTILIDILTKPFTDRNVPFACTLGNHDNHVNLTHLQEIIRLQAVAPTSYTRRSPRGVGGKGGEGNYWVPVYADKHDRVPSLIMWFFDSRSGFTSGANSVPIPDWVDRSVAIWLDSELALMEAVWGPSTSRAAIAFVHVPFHAMQPLQATLDHTKQPGLDEDHLGVGSVQASVDPEHFGVGKDKPFWKTLTSKVKNLHAVVSGHDHGNEWCAREPNTKQILCFNKHTGYGGYSHRGWGHGIRTFLLTLGNLTASVESWITMEDGTRKNTIILDSSYGY